MAYVGALQPSLRRRFNLGVRLWLCSSKFPCAITVTKIRARTFPLCLAQLAPRTGPLFLVRGSFRYALERTKPNRASSPVAYQFVMSQHLSNPTFVWVCVLQPFHSAHRPNWWFNADANIKPCLRHFHGLCRCPPASCSAPVNQSVRPQPSKLLVPCLFIGHSALWSRCFQCQRTFRWQQCSPSSSATCPKITNVVLLGKQPRGFPIHGAKPISFPHIKGFLHLWAPRSGHWVPGGTQSGCQVTAACKPNQHQSAMPSPQMGRPSLWQAHQWCSNNSSSLQLVSVHQSGRPQQQGNVVQLNTGRRCGSTHFHSWTAPNWAVVIADASA